MSQVVRPLGTRCATPGEHLFDIPVSRGAGDDAPAGVAGVTVHCANCAGSGAPSPADELAEMVAASRLTIAGLAGLPTRARADLAASGTLARFYQATVAEVRDAAERCRAQFGTELPVSLRSARAGVADGTQVTAALDAASVWLARLS
jgi:hypothetical protein